MAQKSLNCHGGEGELDHVNVITGRELPGSTLNHFHDNTLAPGVSIGEHSHAQNFEMYYIVSGRGTMLLDGAKIEVAAGDIGVVHPGGSHGLVNDSDGDMRIIVVEVKDNLQG
jgi:quercetin dioxygenase-like cupin family protein